MWQITNWRLGKGPAKELNAFEPEQSPASKDVEHFLKLARVQIPLMPLQSSRYVLREERQTLSWLNSYISYQIEDLKCNFAGEDKSFYLAFLEHPQTGDRSVAFRLTTRGLGGHTEWRISVRRVIFGNDEAFFLCAEY